MRTLRPLSIAAAALGLAALGQAPAAAATTFHGSFSGSTVHTGCTTAVTETALSGKWNVALKADGSAAVSAVVFEDGHLHVAWGGAALGRFQQVTAPGEDFSVRTTLTNGATLTMTLKDGLFSYVITPYDLFGLSCSVVTLSGTGTR